MQRLGHVAFSTPGSHNLHCCLILIHHPRRTWWPKYCARISPQLSLEMIFSSSPLACYEQEIVIQPYLKARMGVYNNAPQKRRMGQGWQKHNRFPPSHRISVNANSVPYMLKIKTRKSSLTPSCLSRPITHQKVILLPCSTDPASNHMLPLHCYSVHFSFG